MRGLLLVLFSILFVWSYAQSVSIVSFLQQGDRYVLNWQTLQDGVSDLHDDNFRVKVAANAFEKQFVSYTETVGGVSLKMVAIDGGEFTMGSDDGTDDEKPKHKVNVPDFYMGETEVTQKLWRTVMGEDPEALSFKGYDDCPVNNVSWNDIQEFIVQLNKLTGKVYRLPTEAQWEYAAGGGSSNRTKFGGTNSENELGKYAWYDFNSDYKAHPVGGKLPNSLGLYDMSGNVWEWCEDDSHDDYKNSPTDGSAWVDSPRGSYRVLRGGSLLNSTSHARVALRYRWYPDNRIIILGFRLALVP